MFGYAIILACSEGRMFLGEIVPARADRSARDCAVECISCETFSDLPNHFFSALAACCWAACAAWRDDFFTPTVRPFRPVVRVLCPRTFNPRLCRTPRHDRMFFSRSRSPLIMKSKSLPKRWIFVPESMSFLRFMSHGGRFSKVGSFRDCSIC